MTIGTILDAPSVTGATPEAKKKEVAAAQDFEALLIAQMLRSVRESHSSWLGTDDDDAGATAMGLGEEELAKTIAQAGGFGLSRIIESGLATQSAKSVTTGPEKP